MEMYSNLGKSLSMFESIIKTPDIFLDGNEQFSETIKLEMKNIYDELKAERLLVKTALPQLLIDVFETEQIWQQMELQNEHFSTKSVANVSKILVNKNQLLFNKILLDSTLCDEENNMESDTDDSTHSSCDFPVERDKFTEVKDETSSDGSENGSVLGDEHNTMTNTTNIKQSVEDEFFKLDEMENFLRSEENKMEDTNNNEESDSDEESVDLFKADSDVEENEKVKTAKFKDFFVSKVEEKQTKRNKFLEELEDKDETFKSTFELRQERLQKKIEEIEQNAISSKPWTLQGEISAESRPENSLLEEVVEFDIISRPAPVITEKVTFQLEDVIKQRIKEKNFDSVQRKEKPVESLLEYKKKLVLDQEKSKHSLAHIYEKEFLDQQATVESAVLKDEEKEPELHKEIRTMMRNLFNKLDALSNFHFTPKPAIPELKIVTNLPAVVMEEIAPVTTSEAVLLAPEEIQNKPKGDIIGKNERTKTDKNRERRKKKLKQKSHLKQVILKKNDQKAKKQPIKGKNIQKMNEIVNSKTFKASSGFFSQLQEQVQSSIKNIRTDKKLDKSNKLSAKKLKL